MAESKRISLAAKLAPRDGEMATGGKLTNCYEEPSPKGDRIVKRPGTVFEATMGDACIGQGAYSFGGRTVIISCDTLRDVAIVTPIDPGPYPLIVRPAGKMSLSYSGATDSAGETFYQFATPGSMGSIPYIVTVGDGGSPTELFAFKIKIAYGDPFTTGHESTEGNDSLAIREASEIFAEMDGSYSAVSLFSEAQILAAYPRFFDQYAVEYPSGNSRLVRSTVPIGLRGTTILNSWIDSGIYDAFGDTTITDNSSPAAQTLRSTRTGIWQSTDTGVYSPACNWVIYDSLTGLFEQWNVTGWYNPPGTAGVINGGQTGPTAANLQALATSRNRIVFNFVAGEFTP